MSTKPFEPGSYAASSSAKAAAIEAIEWPAFNWRKGLTASESLQIREWTKLDFHEWHDISEEMLAALEALTLRASERLELAARGGTISQVSALLLQFAEMLGCRVPGDDGLNLMTAALGSLPFLLHDAAALRVAQTHKYNRLPLPSEFLKAVEGELLFLAMQRRSLGSIQQSISNIRARRIAAARILHQ